MVIPPRSPRKAMQQGKSPEWSLSSFLRTPSPKRLSLLCCTLFAITVLLVLATVPTSDLREPLLAFLSPEISFEETLPQDGDSSAETVEKALHSLAPRGPEVVEVVDDTSQRDGQVGESRIQEPPSDDSTKPTGFPSLIRNDRAPVERPMTTTSIHGLGSENPTSVDCLSTQQKKVLKVFVYDLPRKFNFGLFAKQKASRGNFSEGDDTLSSFDKRGEAPWGSLDGEAGALPPPWPWTGATHPTAKQHSMEYYIVADLLYPPGERHPGTVAMRVTDPEEADVFLVPAFPSLMVNTYRKRHWDLYKKLALELTDFLSNSPWWQRSGGRDHVLLVHHPCALETIRDWLSGAVFVVVDFARFHPATANPVKDLVHPYNQLVSPYSRQQEEEAAKGQSLFDARTTLVFFQGSSTGRPTRKHIMDSMQGEADVHVQDVKASLESIQETEQAMRLAKFCLHIVGDTPSASRFFSAIVSGCVPVVISDEMDLPFESSINYAQFTIFISEKAALQKGYVAQRLRAVTKERWMQMWMDLHKVQHHFLFQVPSLPGDAVDLLWREVQRKQSWQWMSRHRDLRLRIPDWWDHEDVQGNFYRRRQKKKGEGGNRTEEETNTEAARR